MHYDFVNCKVCVVKDSLAGEVCNYNMDPEDQIRLKKNIKAITDNLVVDDIFPHLLQDFVLNYNDSQVIKHEITKRDQALKLIELLLTRGPKAYGSFYASLSEGYGYLATLLDKTSVSLEEVHKFDVIQDGEGTIPAPSTTYRSQSPRPPSVSGADNECCDVEDELRTQYKTHMRYVSPVPWLESFQVELNSVYTNLQMVRALNRNANFKANVEEKALVSTSELFVAKDNKTTTRRVLVEGEPGIGKTTFCCKLCYDWANGKDIKSTTHGAKIFHGACRGTQENIFVPHDWACSFKKEPDNPLQRFSSVLALRSRDLDPKKSIVDCLYEQLMPEDFPVSKQQFKDIVTSNQERILIIVDGYDELMEQHSDFNKLISGKILSHVSVLVTSRPGFALNMLKYFESIFVIVGYGETQRFEFIDKFSAALNDADVVQHFDAFKVRLAADDVLSQLCRNPLHLCILCMLLEDAKTMSLPQTKTELYQEMEEFMLRRAAESMDMSYEELRNKCIPLGEIAFLGLLRGQTQVTEEEIAKYCDVKCLQHLGFFCRQVTLKKFKHIAVYNFTHKSFQEYFAAKYIGAPRRTKQQRLDLARELLHTGNNKLVMVFLCGLLRKNHYALVELINILNNETYLPFISTEYLSLHDVNENHNAHTIFHCLREVDIIGDKEAKDLLHEKLGPKLLACKIEQVSLSYPWCSAECLEGVLKLCSLVDQNCFVCTTAKNRKTSKNNNNLLEYTGGDVQSAKYDVDARRNTSATVNLKTLAFPTKSTTEKGRPRSLDSLLDGDPKPPPRHKNVKMIFQRALIEMKNNSVAKSPMEEARCKKFSITAPGPLVSERRQLFERFMTELVRLRHVEAFSVHDITTVAQVETLFNVLARVGRPRLTSLALRFLGVIDTTAKPLKIETTYFHWVQSLSIIECPNVEVLLTIINAIPSANSIRYLSFMRCTFDAETLKALCDKLQRMKCLKTFDFRQNNVSPRCPDILELLTALEHHQHLAHFGISNLTTRIASPVSGSLFLDTMLFPKDDTFFSHLSPYVCHIIGSNNLESLCISNSTLGMSLLGILMEAVRSSRTLTKLDLPNNYVLPDGYPILTKLLTIVVNANFIEEVNFLGTELNPDNFKAMSQILRNGSQIRSVMLGIYNTDDLNIFSNGLLRNRSLEALEIRKIIFTEESIVDFANAIAHHPFLKTLILSTNDMTPVKVSSLFSAIKTSSSLQYIALRHFRLEDLHMIELSQVIGLNENLLKVDLQSNLIGPSGVELLYKKLQYREKLWKMNLSDNAAKEFHDEVKLLKTRVLYLKVNWF